MKHSRYALSILVLLLALSLSMLGRAQGFGGKQVIIEGIEHDKPKDVYSADLDGDGDMDVLSASSSDNKIAWYENQGGGSFSAQKVITTDANGTQSVYAADLDGDGDADVLSASLGDHKIAWYENQGGGSFSAQKVISDSADGARSVYAADLDGDGDADVLSASEDDDKIAWYENQGGGSFGAQQVINQPDTDGDDYNDQNGNADGARSVYAADLDGDGHMDVLSASFNDDKIAWYENQGGGSFGSQQAINQPDTDGDEDNDQNGNADGAESVYAADLDGDGDADVLSASDNDDKIAWYENQGGSFGTQQVINQADPDPSDINTDGNADGAESVYAADLDGDGDMDVLSASDRDDKIAWYENQGGSFGAQQVITTDAGSAQSVYAADLDGDGDPDVLSASSKDDKIAWYENQGGGSFGDQQLINQAAEDLNNDGDFLDDGERGNAISAQSVYAADLDGDGDMDVLSASGRDDKIAWYENQGGGSFSSQKVINQAAQDLDNDSFYEEQGNADGVGSVYAADLDGDGDTDVLSASRNDNKIAWYENLLGD